MQPKDDEKLDEVKAILRRLQRIGTGDEEGAVSANTEPSPPPDGSSDDWASYQSGPPSSRANIAPPPQHASADDAEQASSRYWLVAFAGVAVVLLIAGLAFAFWPMAGKAPRLALPGKVQPDPAATERARTTAAIPQPDTLPSPESSTSLQPPTSLPAGPRSPSDEDAARISEAMRLIDEGRVVAGRDMLLDGLADRTADAALALARSYDPNSVRLIPNADATPDVEQAERWYRRWYDIAVSDGLALDAQRLDRIIKAMR